MGLKSFVKKALKVTGVGFVLKQFGSLLSALLPKVKTPKSLEQGSSTYNADARVNSSKLGDTKAVVHGQCWVWPAWCSFPFKYFSGHDQFFAVYLHITVGHAAVPRIRIGDTDATRFPGFLSELCLPGEDMTLILPNVYTCPEVEQVELLGGALEQADPQGPGTIGPFADPDTPYKIVTVEFYEEGTTTIDAAAGTWTSDTDEAFSGFQVNDLIITYDSGANNGQRTIIWISDDLKSIKTDPPPASTTTQTDIGFFVAQRWTNSFPACPAGATVETIALDFIFNALRDKDRPNDERIVVIKVQYRPINDAGDPTGPGTWTDATDGITAGGVSYADNVNRVRRYTTEFALSGPMRPEVRVWRETYEQRDQEDPSSAAQWVGLKGYIIPKDGDSPESDADSTRIAILIRSSGMLASQSENAVNCLVKRLVPVYESGGWSDPVFTRNPAWAAVDWMVNQSQGAIELDDLDIASFVDSAAQAETDEDTFDAVFDREVGLWEGAQSILRVARSKPILDPFTRLYKVYRDEPSDPVQLFCDGFNCRTGTDSINLPDADTVSGVFVTFMDPLLWTEREGPTVGTDTDPRKTPGFGFTSWDTAWREASFEYRDLLYRNHTVSISTEMEGLIPLHGNRIILASAEKGWGHAGEVVEQTGTTLRVWPAPIWTAGMNHFVYLQDDEGVPVGPLPCSQGSGPDVIVLDSDPGLTLRVGAAWRSLYAFGHDGTGTDADAPRIAIVQERTSDELRTATLNLLFDHPFVHEDPGPAPVDPYATDSTIPDLTLENLVAEQEVTGDVLTDPSDEPLTDPSGEFLLAPGGEEGGVLVRVTWDAVAGATSYQPRWKYQGIPGWHYATTIDNELTFSPPTNGVIQVNVKALSTTYVGPETITTVEINAYP